MDDFTKYLNKQLKNKEFKKRTLSNGFLFPEIILPPSSWIYFI